MSNLGEFEGAGAMRRVEAIVAGEPFIVGQLNDDLQMFRKFGFHRHAVLKEDFRRALTLLWRAKEEEKAAKVAEEADKEAEKVARKKAKKARQAENRRRRADENRKSCGKSCSDNSSRKKGKDKKKAR